MSDRPGIEIVRAAKTQKRQSPRKRWLLFLFIFLLIIILLITYLLCFTTSMDGVKRFFRYFGKDASYGSIRLDRSELHSYTTIEDLLAVAGTNGITVFNEDGSVRWCAEGSYSSPALKSKSEYLLAYDIGGTALTLFQSDGEVLFALKTKNPLYDAEVSEEGFVAVLCGGTIDRAAFEVYNPDGELLYRRDSKTKYLNACAISPDGSFAAISAFTDEDFSLKSSVQYLKTDREELRDEFSTENRLIYDLAFTDSETVCAVSSDALLFFGGESQKECTGKLLNYSFDGDGYVTALFELTANRSRLVTLDADGNTIASTELSALPLSVTSCGDYISVLTRQELLIFDSGLTLRNQTTNNGYLCALARSDGTAICIASEEAALYIP